MNENGNIRIHSPNIKITRFYVGTGKTSEQIFRNLIVTQGLNLMRDHLMSTLNAPTLDHFILGTGSTPAYSTDTSLQSSSVTLAFVSSTQRPGGVTFATSLGTTVGVGTTFKEIGIFTSSSYLVGRSIILIPIVKTSSSLTIETINWAFDFSL